MFLYHLRFHQMYPDTIFHARLMLYQVKVFTQGLFLTVHGVCTHPLSEVMCTKLTPSRDRYQIIRFIVQLSIYNA